MTAVWRTACALVWAWIYKFWRWLFSRPAPHHAVQHLYRGPRLHPVSCLAYPAYNGVHALRKPDWVRDAVFALAGQSIHSGLGCRSIAQLFNLHHQAHGVSVSKSLCLGCSNSGRMP